MADTDFSGQFESRAESDTSQEDRVARWMSEWDLAGDAESPWRKEAEISREHYRAEKSGAERKFNIHFSNVQTSVPSLYNSTPTPDVRTRYSDENEVSRTSCQAIERVLSYSVDTYDFDSTIKSAVQDREIAGRGQARVRYVPMSYQGKVYQEVVCEHVPWKHYRQGPATRFEDVPWIAFEHFLTRAQLNQLAPKVADEVKLDFSITDGKDQQKADAAPNVFKRARVIEIWDKDTRKVIWIATSYTDGPIREDDDPLGLVGFYPVACPLYAIRTSDSMVPVCPYRIIKPLADELEDLTVRIQALIRVCKWRGIRHPAIPSFELLEDAVDGELVAPVDGSDTLGLIQGGGLDKFIWLMPIDQLVKVLQQLYVQREQVKQTIFEVGGLADIMRGQSDPNETLGAQELKANFGTMRLQDAQKDVQRFCRDLFRLKAEIACNIFDSQNLQMMTGLNLPSRQEVMGAKMQLQQMQQPPPLALPPPGPQNGPQMPPGAQGATPGTLVPQGPPPPQQPPPELVEMAGKVSWEDVLETLKSGVMRMYRIDVETDSTIRGDVMSQQRNASAFVEGSAKFMQAMGPAVEAGYMKPDIVIDLYSSFSRMFKLGKQAEDALARWSQEAQEQAKNPQPPPPDPEMLKIQAEEKNNQMRLQFEQQKAAQDAQLGQAKAQQDAQLKQQEFEHGAKIKEAEFQHQTKLEEFKVQSETQLAKEKMAQDFAIRNAEAAQQRELAAGTAQLEREKIDRQHSLEERKMAHDGQKFERQMGFDAHREGVKYDFEREKFDRQHQMEREKVAHDQDVEDMLVDGRKKAGKEDDKKLAAVTAEIKDVKDALKDVAKAVAAIKSSTATRHVIRGPDGRVAALQTSID